MMHITPVILSGGSGTRLWPMSRPEMPKQFLPLTGKDTMFQMTLARVQDPAKFTPPLIVANATHRNIIEEQLSTQEIDDAKLLLEPAARNTAPAIGLAALACDAPDAIMLVMPSDHVIRDVEAFHNAIDAALPCVQNGWLATFGIEATSPETGYGYIKMAEVISDGVFNVERFIEKPNVDTAQAMLDEGGYAWNGGIFLFRADSYLEVMSQFAPDMLASCNAAMAKRVDDGNAILPDADAFAACPSDSIDYAIMEKASKVAVAPVSMGWSDVGSWDALYDIAHCDDSISNIVGTGNLVKSDGINIHMAGIENMIVVASGNDVMIVPRGESQRVKEISEKLKTQD